MLVPDLKQYYDIDLRGLFDESDPLSPRWVMMHVKTLPIGSAFGAECRGGQQFRGWDESMYALAMISDATNGLLWAYAAAHRKTKPKAPIPFPIPRKVRAKNQSHKPGSFGFMAAKALEAAKKKRKEGV